MRNLLGSGSFKSVSLFLFLTFVAASVFDKNLFQFVDDQSFADFQKDSEALVVGNIVADDLHVQKDGAHLGMITKGTIYRPEHMLESYDILAGEAPGVVNFHAYRSQYGIQGIAFSRIHQYLRFGKLSHLRRINSVLLAVVLVSFFFLYRRIYDHRFAVIFLATMVCSPWVIWFARNLYWAPFLWFVPALLAAMLYLARGTKTRAVLLLGIAFAVFMKSLAGYEYITTVVLFTCSVFVIGPFFKGTEQSPVIDWRMLLLVFTACCVGFLGALLIHARTRGDTIVAGLQAIYRGEVQRRLYGDPSLFGQPNIKASLEASPLAVVHRYIANWHSDLVAWLPGYLFKLLIGVAVAGIVYKLLVRHNTRWRDLVVFASLFVVPVSWFVIGKAHSFDHPHMNFVLWYFGFVAALVYVAFNTVAVLVLAFRDWVKTADAKDF